MSTGTTFTGCDKCKSLSGYYIVTLENGEELAKKCRCLKIYEDKEKLRRLSLKAGLPENTGMYSIKDYIGLDTPSNLPKMKKYIAEFGTRYYDKHLYLYGSYGTQKTTMSCYMGRELLKEGFSVTYATMNKIIADYVDKSDFQKKEEVDVSRYEDVDFLIVDEAFDKNKILWYSTNYQMSFLDSFLRRRLEVDRKATLFVSNVEPTDIAEKFDIGLQDLIVRNTRPGWLVFHDHYSLKDSFDVKTMWED